MKSTRRRLLQASLFGAGLYGLRSLVTGAPPSWFLGQRVVHAADAVVPQFLILATSDDGDPLNANCPGSYVAGAENNPYPELAPVDVALGATRVTAAKCWADLPEALRARLSFFHHRTYTNAHAEHRKVMSLHGSAKSATGNGEEMLPSLLASELAVSLGTIQAEPVPLGSERITFEGRALDNIEPSGLKALFDQPDDLLYSLAELRDQEIDKLYSDLRVNGSRVQRQFLDRFALGRDQVRKLGEDLANLLTRLPVDPMDADSPIDQVVAAVALIRLKVAPVVTLHLPFGGDNHNDSDLVAERDQALGTMATLSALWTELVSQALEDQVSFASLNVFGRTLKRNAGGGRNHNQNHHVMCLFGKNVNPGVIGGIEELDRDFAASTIDSATGRPGPGGDIDPLSSLESAAKTLGSALDLPIDRLESRIGGGKVVSAALV